MQWLARVAGAGLPDPAAALDVGAALVIVADGAVITEPPSVDALADALDRDRLAVRRAISDLTRAGFLVVGVRADGEPVPLVLAMPNPTT